MKNTALTIAGLALAAVIATPAASYATDDATPTTVATTEPTLTPTTEPTSTLTSTPTAAPAIAPTAAATTAPTTAPTTPPTAAAPAPAREAVVELPTLPSGSVWHDCETGWTYDLDASWDWEFVTVAVTGPDGEPVSLSDGTTREGTHTLTAKIKPGRTFDGAPVVGFDAPLPADWAALTTRDGHVTAATRTFTVAFPTAPACEQTTSSPTSEHTAAASDAASTSASTPTTDTLANTGADTDPATLAGTAALGLALIGAGAGVIARARR